MNIWVREAIGGVLLLAGLVVAGFCVWFLYQGFVVEGGLLVFLTLIVLGAGSQLLKVALAVRALEARRNAQAP
ncbi:MAG: hypothetical protein HYZ53_18850 [Planctomycetes bacterium]|nr:hypothetical protein [Planctomycetota bacterium]